VNAIQQSRDLSCRIVAPSQGTKDYSNLGCEVVKADLDSVESIRKALDGISFPLPRRNSVLPSFASTYLYLLSFFLLCLIHKRSGRCICYIIGKQ
jgi:hypothetical protein